MIPRNKLDIGWADFGFGLLQCLLPGKPDAQQTLENFWSPGGNGLACLSVRSGFDALLSELNFPKGSEILLSAITIRDMPRIIEEHGLIAVPVDLNMETLALKTDALERSITPATRALLVAHLFGSRIDMTPYAEFARKHHVLLLEDCAQAFTGDDYRGHAQSDVTMFSFGTIKTATALGGALLRFKDKGLLDKIRARQLAWPTQTRMTFFKKLLKSALLQFVSIPTVFTLFAQLCKLAGTDHDKIITKSIRGFAGADFFNRIRHQPSAPLIALLHRRMKQFDQAVITQRRHVAEGVAELANNLAQPGSHAAFHSHWVFPVLSDSPDELVKYFWQHGFDASRGASSMYAVPPHGQTTAQGEVAATMQHLLYLPMHPAMKSADMQRLAKVFNAYRTN